MQAQFAHPASRRFTHARKFCILIGTEARTLKQSIWMGFLVLNAKMDVRLLQFDWRAKAYIRMVFYFKICQRKYCSDIPCAGEFAYPSDWFRLLAFLSSRKLDYLLMTKEN